MVLKYQKQAAKEVTGSNYTKNKLIYGYMLVYISKIDPGLGFWIYNPGEENLVDLKNVPTYLHININSNFTKYSRTVLNTEF